MRFVIKIIRQLGGRHWVLLVGVTSASLLIIGNEIWRLERERLTSLHDPRYLVANRRISEGELLTLLDFGYTLKVPESNVSETVWFTDQDLEQLKGATARREILSGAHLSWDDVSASPRRVGFSKILPKGFNAYSLVQSEPMVLRRGEKVDVLFVSQNSMGLPVLLAEEALVLDHVNGPQGSVSTLALTRDEIALMEKAKQTGKLKLSVRSSKDHPNRRVTKSLPGSRRSRPQKMRVEILSEVD